MEYGSSILQIVLKVLCAQYTYYFWDMETSRSPRCIERNNDFINHTQNQNTNDLTILGNHLLKGLILLMLVDCIIENKPTVQNLSPYKHKHKL
jgi:hypothetical protein